MNNITVIIPCYEPSEQKLIPYIEQLLKASIKNIIIVNDGSDEKYRHVFEKAREIGADRLHFMEYAENRGKGYALKAAYKYCKDAFDESAVFVTADCDGQHSTEDVIKVGLYTAENPDSLVLGVRDFSLPHVPKRSRTGNTKTRWILNFLYGVKISDTQTGLRGIPYSLLEPLIKVPGDRFEYETNQLIRLNKKRIPIKEVPIETIYDEKPDDVERISHFKTIRDSARVIGVLLSNLGWYFFSGAVSAVADVAVFALLFGVILPIESLTLKTLIATVSARVLSSLINFTCNYKLVFKGTEKKSIIKYYILWLLQLGASFGLARLWAGIASSEILVSIFKALSDIVLAVISYQVQRIWVFSHKNDYPRFYGSLARFAKWSFGLFYKKYDTTGIEPDKDGCVFICRHLNMHGCYTAVRSLDFDLHIMAFNVFFSFKKAYEQFSGITFAKNGKATFLSKFMAFPLSVVIPPSLRSSKAIPVYRSSIDSYKTIRAAGKYTAGGEPVILFPDVEYTAGEDEQSEIYKGFLLIERIYYRETHKHLKFIPLVIDEKAKRIYARDAIMFEDGSFMSQLDGMAQKIKDAIQPDSMQSVGVQIEQKQES